MKTLTIGQQVVVTPVFVDASNNQIIGLENAPVWANDNPTLFTTFLGAANLSATLVNYGNFGSANITVTVGTFTISDEIIVSSPDGGSFNYSIPTAAGLMK